MKFPEPDKKTMFLSRYGSSKHVEQAIDQKHPDDTTGAYKSMMMLNPFATKEQLTKIMPDPRQLSTWGEEAYSKHPNVPGHIKDHIMNVTDHPDAIENLMKNPAFTKEDLDKHVKTMPYHSKTTRILLSHPLADHQTYMNALEHTDYRSKLSVFDNKSNTKISPSHVKKALQDKDEMVRWKAIKHPSADIEELEHHAKHDPSPLVRLTAIKNEYAPRDLIKHVRDNDQDEDVRNVAKRLLEH